MSDSMLARLLNPPSAEDDSQPFSEDKAPPLSSSKSDNILDSLNPPQRQAVETLEGPLLILAGAGTGKTRVLTIRLAEILRHNKAWPHQILAVTFTNKAAQEMKERVQTLVGPQASQGLWMGTFHSLALRILRHHTDLIGRSRNFTVLDADDQFRLVKQIIKAEAIDDKKYPPKLINSVIGRWKDRGLFPDQVPNAERVTAQGNPHPIYSVYTVYQKHLQTVDALDFGDLLLYTLDLFRCHSDILKRYHEQFRYILVDEYQDTNVAQYLWLRLLAQGSGNVCCVGDDDQSIYGWRGAQVENILRFEKDFPGATVVRLEQNYRSTSHILGAASGLIAYNKDRLGKTLWTDANKGDVVAVKGVWDSEEEARFIAEEVESLHRKGVSPARMAVLVRASFQTREFEERFMKLGMAYKVVGGMRFYERLEIRDAIAYLRVVAQPKDSLAFERIMNTPKRGIGQASVQTLHTHARLRSLPLIEATLQVLETDEIRGKAKNALSCLLTDIKRWSDLISEVPLKDLATQILEESGYLTHWANSKLPDAPGRVENLKEFLKALEQFDHLEEFLEHVSLVMDNATQAEAGDAINIMTLHSAKGLEFDSVFLAGWEEGLFPHARSLDEEGEAGLQEERRLAYVGITRAQRKAFITYAARRQVHGTWKATGPSRFIRELPPKHIEHSTQGGLYSSYSENNVSSSEAYKDYNTSKKRPLGPSSSEYQRGDRVFHQKFGYGYVLEVEHDRLEINFDHSGPKRILGSFVKKA